MPENLDHARTYIEQYAPPGAKIAVILGSGLGSFGDSLTASVYVRTNQIPAYPVSTVAGHEGRLVFGTWSGIPVIAVQGRTHYYEGYSAKQITFIVRILAALGIKLLIVTNAAGGINRRLKPGDLMLITDHINLMFTNPLIGSLDYGEPRFPDMSDAYAHRYRQVAEEIARTRKIGLKFGTLYASSGPSYETGAEVRMIAKLGGDAVSMSTIPEVIAANHAGMAVLGISCITNMATGISRVPLSHDEVTATADRVRKKFIYLLTGIIEQLGKSKEF